MLETTTDLAKVLDKLRDKQTYDYLRLRDNHDIQKFLLRQRDDPIEPLETVQFSDEVVKINRKSKRQKRVLVLTNKAVYNFMKKVYSKCRRRILLADISKTVLSRCSDELVLQVSNSYDYRYEIRRRGEVLELINRYFETTSKHPLDLIFSEEKELTKFVVTRTMQTDMQRRATFSSSRPTTPSIASQRRDSLKASQTAAQALDQHLSPKHTFLPSFREHDTRFEGWLTKKKGKTDKWDRKYCVLNGEQLQYFSTKIKGNMELVDFTIEYDRDDRDRDKEATILSLNPSSSSIPSSSSSGGGSGSATPTAGPGAHKRRDSKTGTNGTHTPLNKTPSKQPPPLSASASPSSTASTLSALTLSVPSTNLLSLSLSGAPSPTAPSSSSSTASNTGASTNSTSPQFPSQQQQQSQQQLLQLSSSSSSSSSSSGGVSSPGFSPSPSPSAAVFASSAPAGTGAGLFSPLTPALIAASVGTLSPAFGPTTPPGQPPSLTSTPSFSNLNAGSAASYLSAAYPPAPLSTSNSGLFSLNDVKDIITNLDDVPTDYLQFRCHLKSKSRREPLYFAAESEADLEQWMNAIKGRQTDQDPTTMETVEGWLMKKDPTSKTWRKTYFALIDNRLWYLDMIPKGTIDVTAGVNANATGIVHPTEEAHKNFAGYSSRSQFCFRWNISDSVRNFYLAADTAEEMAQWVAAVHSAARQYTQNPGQASIDERKLAGVANAQEAISQKAPTGQVTFVFTDVQSSTTLWERVPDSMEIALELHDKILRLLLRQFNGYEVKTEGDAFMVTFFSVIEAILWCLAVQEMLMAQEWPPEFTALPAARREIVRDDVTGQDVVTFNGIRIRMGVHTGEPTCKRNPTTGRMDYFGPVVNKTARVSDTAHGGQVVVTHDVFTALTDPGMQDERLTGKNKPVITFLGAHNLKGLKKSVRIYQVMSTSLSHRKFPPLRLEKGKESGGAGGSGNSPLTKPHSLSGAGAAPASSSSAASSSSSSVSSPPQGKRSDADAHSKMLKAHRTTDSRTLLGFFNLGGSSHSSSATAPPASTASSASPPPTNRDIHASLSPPTALAHLQASHRPHSTPAASRQSHSSNRVGVNTHGGIDGVEDHGANDEAADSEDEEPVHGEGSGVGRAALHLSPEIMSPT